MAPEYNNLGTISNRSVYGFQPIIHYFIISVHPCDIVAMCLR